MTLVAFAFLARPLLQSNRLRAIGVVAVALPAAAALLYARLGFPEAGSPTHPAQHFVAAKAPNANGSVGSVASMVDDLASRLESEPDDAGGWLLLSRSYQHLGRTEEASEAYARAAALGATDPDFAAHEKSSSQPIGPSISGSVRLSDRAMKTVQPQDQIFVFARAPNEPGPPAAVLRRSVGELPLEFRLSDADAMVDSVKLSNFEQVVVTARISRSGAATETLQDLEARTSPVIVGSAGRVELVIE